MKLPLIITVAFLPCLALAQSTTDTPPSACPAHMGWHHGQMTQQQLTTMLTALGVSDTQQGQILPILISQQAQAKTIFENTSLTREQKHDQIKALLESTAKQVEAYLTPDQVNALESLRQWHNNAGTGQ